MLDISEHQLKLSQALANIETTLHGADNFLQDDRKKWMLEFEDLASIGVNADKNAVKREEHIQFDTSIFGPALEASTPEKQAEEISGILLAKDKDFTDALINIDRDNFLSNPYDSAIRDASLIKSVSAGIYGIIRGLYLGLNVDHAMANVHYYRFLIRHLRSQLYLSTLITENIDRVCERMFNLEIIKEKYEATIFTLRRQLDDYHRSFGSVGRNAEGKLVVNEVTGKNPIHGMMAAAATASAAERAIASGEVPARAAEPSFFLVVQIEELGNLRSRQRPLMEKVLEQARELLVSVTTAFGAKRTNYHDEQERREKFNPPTCFMFCVPDSPNALALALEIHAHFHGAEWPKNLTDMTRFGGTLWRGLRVRIGIHFGESSLVDSPAGTVVDHYEGIVVEKAMRIASLAAAGDTLVSKAAWEEYQAALKNGRIPPSKRFTQLRTVESEKVDCSRKRGFKKEEFFMQVWAQALVARKTTPIDVDFALISFFGLEVGKTVEVDDAPNADDLLQAKETEITLLQQELDALRLAIIKRDADIEEIRARMVHAVEELRERVMVKTFYFEGTNASLEEQLMNAHDMLSYVSAVSPAVGKQGRDKHASGIRDAHGSKRPSVADVVLQHRRSIASSDHHGAVDTDTVLEDDIAGESPQPDAVRRDDSSDAPMSLTPPAGEFGPMFPSFRRPRSSQGDALARADLRRRERFQEWKENNEEIAGASTSQSAGLSSTTRDPLGGLSPGDGAFVVQKHKNMRLWRELNSLVSGATAKTTNKAITRNRSYKHGSNDDMRRSHGNVNTSMLLRLHNVIRVYDQLLKRFSVVGDVVDSDNQSISEEQFISLFMRMVQPDAVGSVREAFLLLLHAAIDNEDVEEANATDDHKLTRSIIGHLVRIFTVFRAFKKKAIVESNIAGSPDGKTGDDDIDAACAGHGSPTSGTAKGGGGKGKGTQKAVVGRGKPVSPQPRLSNAVEREKSTFDATERAKMLREITDREDKLEQAKERARKDQDMIKQLQMDVKKVKTDMDRLVKSSAVSPMQPQMPSPPHMRLKDLGTPMSYYVPGGCESSRSEVSLLSNANATLVRKNQSTQTGEEDIYILPQFHGIALSGSGHVRTGSGLVPPRLARFQHPAVGSPQQHEHVASTTPYLDFLIGNANSFSQLSRSPREGSPTSAEPWASSSCVDGPAGVIVSNIGDRNTPVRTPSTMMLSSLHQHSVGTVSAGSTDGQFGPMARSTVSSGIVSRRPLDSASDVLGQEPQWSSAAGINTSSQSTRTASLGRQGNPPAGGANAVVTQIAALANPSSIGASGGANRSSPPPPASSTATPNSVMQASRSFPFQRQDTSSPAMSCVSQPDVCLDTARPSGSTAAGSPAMCVSPTPAMDTARPVGGQPSPAAGITLTTPAVAGQSCTKVLHPAAAGAAHNTDTTHNHPTAATCASGGVTLPTPFGGRTSTGPNGAPSITGTGVTLATSKGAFTMVGGAPQSSIDNGSAPMAATRSSPEGSRRASLNTGGPAGAVGDGGEGYRAGGMASGSVLRAAHLPGSDLAPDADITTIACSGTRLQSPQKGTGPAVSGRRGEDPVVETVQSAAAFSTIRSASTPIGVAGRAVVQPQTWGATETARHAYDATHVLGPLRSVPRSALGNAAPLSASATTAVNTSSSTGHLNHQLVGSPQGQPRSVTPAGTSSSAPSTLTPSGNGNGNPQNSGQSPGAPLARPMLQFAMTSEENKEILRVAAEEREAYYAEQRRLHEQMVELRRLQAQSSVLLGNKGFGHHNNGTSLGGGGSHQRGASPHHGQQTPMSAGQASHEVSGHHHSTSQPAHGIPPSSNVLMGITRIIPQQHASPASHPQRGSLGPQPRQSKKTTS